jgi:hypothetical protein
MKTLHALLFFVLFGIHAVAVERGPRPTEQLKDLLQKYARDDKRLPGALHYVKKSGEGQDDALREEAWVLETGEPVKVLQERRRGDVTTLDEYSIDGDIAYFVFHRVDEKQKDGGTRVTEERTYVVFGDVIAKRRRIVNFPAGVPPEMSPQFKSEELDIKTLPEAERHGWEWNKLMPELLKRICVDEALAHDPAKGAPAEWEQVKLVAESMSPDNRYALAIRPKKKGFDWSDYLTPELGEHQYMVEDEDGVANFIVDLQTHRLVGKTLGEHFGNRARYNHRTCSMFWSPDSHFFIQMTNSKWQYEKCCLGHVEDGKMTAMLDLGKAAKKRAAEFLVAAKNRTYREHAKEMETDLFSPRMENGGSGSIGVIFQVIKADYVSARVRFRVVNGKSGPQLEMLGAELAEP